MLAHPEIDPVAFAIGPVRVHWYGIMYLIAFSVGWWLGRVRARDPARGFAPVEVDDILFYGALGVVVGGRLGYVVFYDWAGFVADPLSLVRVWQGGMSFHGGLLGVMLAMWMFARRTGRSFFAVTDFVAPLFPPGLAAGRIGNFINGNLWGRESDLPWAMVFSDPRAGDVARHPSQLYQALLEGALLFIVLWLYSRRPRPVMAVSGLFLLGYGAARAVVEFVRVPDAHIGYVAFGWVTVGHVLTLPMLLAGAGMLWWAHRRGGSPADLTASASAPAAAEVPHAGRPGRARRRGRRR